MGKKTKTRDLAIDAAAEAMRATAIAEAKAAADELEAVKREREEAFNARALLHVKRKYGRNGVVDDYCRWQRDRDTVKVVVGEDEIRVKPSLTKAEREDFDKRLAAAELRLRRAQECPGPKGASRRHLLQFMFEENPKLAEKIVELVEAESRKAKRS